jgi:hypothetical protein
MPVTLPTLARPGMSLVRQSLGDLTLKLAQLTADAPWRHERPTTCSISARNTLNPAVLIMCRGQR